MPDEEKVAKAIEYLNWYFTQDDGAADKNAVKAWEVLTKEQGLVKAVKEQIREKVILGLTVCTDGTPSEDCRKCPYHGKEYCTDAVMLDALALLKELEPEQAILRGTTWFCPRCKNPIDMFRAGEENSYCPYCGKEVKWNG